MELLILPLTHPLLLKHLEVVMRIDLPMVAERWEEKHFVVDLPGKWECSRIAFDVGQPVGFMIATIKPESVHINRIAVDAKFQGHGIGTRLLQEAAESAQRYHKPYISLKVSQQNQPAINFYQHLGFLVKDENPENLTLYIQPALLQVSHKLKLP
jgi:ribosomal protein S18 acetylase RimI-like enzyme